MKKETEVIKKPATIPLPTPQTCLEIINRKTIQNDKATLRYKELIQINEQRNRDLNQLHKIISKSEPLTEEQDRAVRNLLNQIQ